jgi:hypothetical protein
VRLEAGGLVKSPGVIRVTYTGPSGARSQPVAYEASVAQYLVAYADLERLRLEPQPAGTDLEVCDRGGAPVRPPAGP